MLAVDLKVAGRLVAVGAAVALVVVVAAVGSVDVERRVVPSERPIAVAPSVAGSGRRSL